ncbi:MAG: XdhC family protein [Anaerolineales bacterium]|nr:XdhC family protein [Anaerolineales bacterium]
MWLTAIAATGVWAGQLGRHLLIGSEAGEFPAGTLDAGALQPRLLDDAQEALRLRSHRETTYEAAGSLLTVFFEVQAPAPHLIVAGAGHIAAPLAAIARICDFEVTVLDDRPQYASQARFPTADRVIAGPFREELRKLRGGRPQFDANTFLVLVTRGHQHDIECLLEVLDDPVAYIGMIGSRRRISAVFNLLEREQRIDPARLDRVFAPIGLDIGAQTPAEIAVCIMSEIINTMRGGPARSLREQVREERIARRTRITTVRGE